MKDYFKYYIAPRTMSLVCIICSAVLACMSISGWGWFLFIAVLCLPSKICVEEGKDENES